ncbi:preprotein translocase subunit SecA [Buchnera aphidicola]|uniref:preprotein translocase subunit SecA n=1 Tax=Buchnera aphidicola TaxID=9 RepID=UPI0031B70F76
MLINLFKKIFSTQSDKILNSMQKTVKVINSMEPKFKNFSDKRLKQKTDEFRKYLNQNGNLENLIPEAFATVREASRRILNMRHYDVQILGGLILHKQCIAEMQTGEGKTLTSTLPIYLNALKGKGCHLVTMNDYLSQRDGKKNKFLFEFLGLSVGINFSGISTELKRKAYLSDITYGTNNEFGFDYLRDNMVFSSKERVQRELYYALIDEVDSILIDEARTPLIISGVEKENLDIYSKINKIIFHMKEKKKKESIFFKGNKYFSVDEKSKQIHLTEIGLTKVENLLVNHNLIDKKSLLYTVKNITLIEYINNALKANILFKKNVDYIIKNKKIIIVDEHTGRIMKGRRWSDGLHQAIEAKENVKIQNENQTLASITFQNYFRLYKKLSGMTGTAATEASEFNSIYNLKTVVIPTNKPMIRKDYSDLVYITEKEKINSIILDIQQNIMKKKPVLVGTTSIEKSEIISNKLKNLGIKHNVLNAKFHSQEANIIAEAGRPGVVTIATNMAGRGTDIVLGGSFKKKYCKNKKNFLYKNNWKKLNQTVVEAGGLHVIGTERHESRRVDNQLRGRSGRQGDPGSSQFYLSMEDSLIRIFSSKRIINTLKKLGIKKDEAIQHKWITIAISNAQKRVEYRNFEIRKQLLEYDDIANNQRKSIYFQRNILLTVKEVSKNIFLFIEDVLKKVIKNYISGKFFSKSWDLVGLEKRLKTDFNVKFSLINKVNLTKELQQHKKLTEYITNKVKGYYISKKKIFGIKKIQEIEKSVLLHNLDFFWKEHLLNMEYLRKGIHLRGYAQKDPKLEYKKESFKMFFKMIQIVKYEVVINLMNFNS